MPCEIVWLPEAARDLVRLREFIQTKNPVAAKRAVERIKAGVNILANNPESGKPVDEIHNFRDLYIAFGSGNYVLRYRKEGRQVIIVSVKHSREASF